MSPNVQTFIMRFRTRCYSRELSCPGHDLSSVHPRSCFATNYSHIRLFRRSPFCTFTRVLNTITGHRCVKGRSRAQVRSRVDVFKSVALYGRTVGMNAGDGSSDGFACGTSSSYLSGSTASVGSFKNGSSSSTPDKPWPVRALTADRTGLLLCGIISII